MELLTGFAEWIHMYSLNLNLGTSHADLPWNINAVHEHKRMNKSLPPLTKLVYLIPCVVRVCGLIYIVFGEACNPPCSQSKKSERDALHCCIITDIDTRAETYSPVHGPWT